MNPVWLVPFLAAVLGGAALVALVRSAVASARELGTELARFGELHVSLAALRADLHDSARLVRELGER